VTGVWTLSWKSLTASQAPSISRMASCEEGATRRYLWRPNKQPDSSDAWARPPCIRPTERPSTGYGRLERRPNSARRTTVSRLLPSYEPPSSRQIRPDTWPVCGNGRGVASSLSGRGQSRRTSSSNQIPKRTRIRPVLCAESAGRTADWRLADEGRTGLISPR
jgi:hypothetical protein